MTNSKLCLFLVTGVFAQGLLPIAKAQSPATSTGALCDIAQDRCNQKSLTPQQITRSGFLNAAVNKHLEVLYEQYKEKGEDLKAVIVSRAGSNLDRFAIMKERDGSETLSEMIARLVTETASAAPLVYDGTAPIPGSISNHVLKDNIDHKQTLKYSHAGIAIRNLVRYGRDGKQVRGPGTGRWTISHLLYNCKNPDAGPNESQYLRVSKIHGEDALRFFQDDLAEYRAQIIIPTPQIQANLEKILTQKDHQDNLELDPHRRVPLYNALARYTDQRQANSNQFVLEAIAAAMSPSEDPNPSRQANIDILARTGYSPTKLTPTGLATLLTSTTIQGWISNAMPTVCFKDQPEIGKYSLGEVVTTNSILTWMRKNSLVLDVLETSLSQEILDMSEKISLIQAFKNIEGAQDNTSAKNNNDFQK